MDTLRSRLTPMADPEATPLEATYLVSLLRAASSTPLSTAEEIAAAFKLLIRNGISSDEAPLQPQTMLPDQTELAKNLDCRRSVLSEAFELLEGWVTQLNGKHQVAHLGFIQEALTKETEQFTDPQTLVSSLNKSSEEFSTATIRDTIILLLRNKKLDAGETLAGLENWTRAFGGIHITSENFTSRKEIVQRTFASLYDQGFLAKEKQGAQTIYRVESPEVLTCAFELLEAKDTTGQFITSKTYRISSANASSPSLAEEIQKNIFSKKLAPGTRLMNPNKSNKVTLALQLLQRKGLAVVVKQRTYVAPENILKKANSLHEARKRQDSQKPSGGTTAKLSIGGFQPPPNDFATLHVPAVARRLNGSNSTSRLS